MQDNTPVIRDRKQLSVERRLLALVCIGTLPLAVIAFGSIILAINASPNQQSYLVPGLALVAVAWLVGVALIWLTLRKIVQREFIDTMDAQKVSLDTGLQEQSRLTREVHHRVKNNLQVVASLLSLHARAAKSEDAAIAYASIQRRVNALAIVQRNLLENTGHQQDIAIRPVIAELAASLHRGARETAKLIISLDIAEIQVKQDIAVPVAFFVTELVELAMMCRDELEITVEMKGTTDKTALLSVDSGALSASQQRVEFERYNRVIQGLARQLRADLETSEDATRYAVEIPVS